MRVSEIFGPVLQGEGYRVGVPSVFLRLFGCNLRCPNFGNTKATQSKNEEVVQIIQHIDKYRTLADLPEVHTGCDTYYAIYPEFKRFAKDMTVDEISHVLVEKASQSSDINGFRKRPLDLVITGGEPLLHQSHLIKLFFETDLLSYYHTITFETNGTQELTKDFKGCLESFETIRWIFSVSPKLTNSGHSELTTLNEQAVASYNMPHSLVYTKFVLDFDGQESSYQAEIMNFLKEYNNAGAVISEVYIMPQGTVNSETYQRNCQQAANWCCEMRFHYSPRLQVELFGNGIGT